MGTSILIFVAWVLMHWFPDIATMYSTMVGALIAVLTVFVGGNVTNNILTGHVNAKFAQIQANQPVEPEDQEDPKPE